MIWINPAAGASLPRGRTSAAVLAVAIPAAAFGIYFTLGSPEMPGQPFAGRNIASEITARQGKLDRSEVMQLVARLLKRLEADPNNVDGWVLLGRTYLTIGKFEGALAAYRKAMEVGNRHPEIVTDYAEALVLSGKGQVGPEAQDLFEDISEADPYNPRAGYYLGLGLAQRGNLKAALQAWVDLRAVSLSGSPWLEMVDLQIARAAEDLQVAPWSVKPSAKALVLASGGEVAIFDKKVGSAPERYPLGDTPLSIILAKSVDLSRSGMVTSHTYDGTSTVVRARDPKRPEIGTIDLVFTGNPVELRQWVIRDDSGGETTVILGELDKNARLPHTDFSIIRAIESLN